MHTTQYIVLEFECDVARAYTTHCYAHHIDAAHQYIMDECVPHNDSTVYVRLRDYRWQWNGECRAHVRYFMHFSAME